MKLVVVKVTENEPDGIKILGLSDKRVGLFTRVVNRFNCRFVID